MKINSATQKNGLLYFKLEIRMENSAIDQSQISMSNQLPVQPFLPTKTPQGQNSVVTPQPRLSSDSKIYENNIYTILHENVNPPPSPTPNQETLDRPRESSLPDTGRPPKTDPKKPESEPNSDQILRPRELRGAFTTLVQRAPKLSPGFPRKNRHLPKPK